MYKLTNYFVAEDVSKDEIFFDLRVSGVSQLGRVDAACIEASGRKG
jgi:uncharacterized membrane protein YcaP (DUF421 family)